MNAFQAATTVVSEHAPDGGEASYRADLHQQWSVGTKLHGGYLLAVLARTALHAAEDRHPHLASVSATFLRSPDPGHARITVRILRAGTTVTHLQAALEQDGHQCVQSLITLATHDDADSRWISTHPAQLPPEVECVTLPAAPPGSFPLPLMEVVRHSVDPNHLGFALGEPTGRGTLSGWQSLADGSPWDQVSLLVALDPIPPTTYDLGLPGWTPTVQLTAHLRRLPAPGPLRVRFQAGELVGDRVDQTAHAWDSSGRLVGVATHLTAVDAQAAPVGG